MSSSSEHSSDISRWLQSQCEAPEPPLMGTVSSCFNGASFDSSDGLRLTQLQSVVMITTTEPTAVAVTQSERLPSRLHVASCSGAYCVSSIKPDKGFCHRNSLGGTRPSATRPLAPSAASTSAFRRSLHNQVVTRRSFQQNSAEKHSNQNSL